MGPSDSLPTLLSGAAQPAQATPTFLGHGLVTSLAAHVILLGGYSLLVLHAPSALVPKWMPPRSGVRSVAQVASRPIVLEAVFETDSEKERRQVPVQLESSTQPDPAPAPEAQDTHLAKRNDTDTPPVPLLELPHVETLPQPTTTTTPHQGRRGIDVQSPDGQQQQPTRLASSLAKRTNAVAVQTITSVASVATRESDGAETEALPQQLYSPAPIYPRAQYASGIGGRVKVRVTLDESGHVVATSIFKSSGVTALDQATLIAVRRWRFEPLSQQRSTVRELLVPIRFDPPAR